MSRKDADLSELRKFIAEKERKRFRSYVMKILLGSVTFLLLALIPYFYVNSSSLTALYSMFKPEEGELNSLSESDSVSNELGTFANEVSRSDEIVVVATPAPEEEFYDEAENDFEVPRQQLVDPPFRGLDIEGERKAGNMLVFSVIGRKSRYKYRLDFGDGRSTTIIQSEAYTYRKPGSYLVSLEVDQDGFNSYKYEVSLNIKPGDNSGSEDNDDSESQLAIASNEVATPVTESVENVDPENVVLDNFDNPFEETDFLEEEDSATFEFPEEDISPEEEIFSPLPEETNEPESQEEIPSNPSKIPEFSPDLPFFQPEFPGGAKNLTKFIRNNLKYPRQAINNQIEGDVMVKFMINKNGSLSDLRITEGLGFGCDEEVLRIIGSMPNWKPARLGTKSISYTYTLSIKFQIN